MIRKNRQLDSAKLLYTTNARLDEVVKLLVELRRTREAIVGEFVENQLLQDYINGGNEDSGETAITVTPTKKKQRSNEILSFQPVSGDAYTKMEVCDLLKSTQERSIQRADTIRAIVHHNGQYVEGCSRHTINRTRKNYCNHKWEKINTNTDWSGAGRPMRVTHKELDAIEERMEQKSEKTYNKKDTKGMMEKIIAKRNEKNGIVQLLDENISRSTVKKHLASSIYWTANGTRN